MSLGETDVRHQPFYCEENIWHLVREDALGLTHAVLIRGAGERFAMWEQRAARGPGEPILWDYHVIALGILEGSSSVFDLDTLLGQPVDLEEYLRASFPFQDRIPEWARPLFHLLSATSYEERFASDRRHMRTPSGALQRPAPPWEPIGEGFTLDALLDPSHPTDGEWFDLDGLLDGVV